MKERGQESARKINWNADLLTEGPTTFRKRGNVFYRMSVLGSVSHGKRKAEIEAEGTGKRPTQAVNRALSDTLTKTVLFLESGSLGSLNEMEIEYVREGLRNIINSGQPRS